MKKDLRKEQVALLRFEKQIAGLAATLAAGAVVAKSVDGKLHASEAQQAYADMQQALMHLAEVTGAAHEVINERAAEAGLRVFEAGIPKQPPQVIASILGLS